jgi:hypothetical protein
MSRINAYVVLAALLAAGCAGRSELADEAPAAALTPAHAAPENAAAASSGTVTPDTVLDANELIARTPPPPICRESLRPNSNVLEKRCMSAESWKLWDRAEAKRAAQIVKMMQGHPSYR